MRKNIITAAIAAALFCTALSAQKPVFSLIPPHPRLLLLQGEEQKIREAIASQPLYNEVHKAIIAESDAVLSKPLIERKLIGKRLLDKSRESLRRIFFLSYSWRMTGDKKYFDRAESEMLNIADFSDWHPEHFLDVAEMTTAMSIGYDWLYPSLSESSRNKIMKAIIRFGIEPSYDRRYNSWLKVVHNWNQVCNSGMTFGALAVYEDNKTLAEETIQRAIESIKIPMSEYNPDGAYPEGYGYWGYGTTYNVLFLSALKKALNFDSLQKENSSFFSTPEYLLHMTGPTGKPFNYSDSGVNSAVNPAMFWFASAKNDPSLLFTEKEYLANPKKLRGERILPALLIWGAGFPISRIPEPQKTSWFGKGQTPVSFTRTSWGKDAIYVAMKGGTPSTNHAHMDAGSFVLDADGIRWAMDFGMQDYESLESKNINLFNMKQNSQRWEVFRYSNLNHNTISLNNNLQDVKGKAELSFSSKNPLFTHTKTDLTSLYSGDCASLKRGIAVVDKKYVVVRDEITTAAKDISFRWTMLTDTHPEIQSDGSVLLTKDGKVFRVFAAEPADIAFTLKSTIPPHPYDAENKGTALICFETALKANKTYNFSIILSPERNAAKAKKPAPLADWK